MCIPYNFDAFAVFFFFTIALFLVELLVCAWDALLATYWPLKIWELMVQGHFLKQKAKDFNNMVCGFISPWGFSSIAMKNHLL